MRISAARQGPESAESILLRFEDNGVGIATGQIDMIFENDFSTKQARGTGLGLHWSANTIRDLGGAIHAESRGFGEGAVINLRLPVHPLSGQPRSVEEGTR